MSSKLRGSITPILSNKTGTHQLLHVPGLTVAPHNLNFGCVCQGFIYHMSITMVSKVTFPQKLKLIAKSINENEANSVNLKYETKAIAMGIPFYLTIEFVAQSAENTVFDLHIIQSSSPETPLILPIRAFVVPMDIFKLIKRSLSLEKKSLYRDGVNIFGSIMHNDEKSHKTNQTGPSVYSEALMDDDEVEEIADLPTIENAYWDPITRQLKYDKEIGQVFVDPSLSMEDAIEKNNKYRSRKCFELEDTGMYTKRVIDRIASQIVHPAAVTTEGSLLHEDDVGSLGMGSQYSGTEIFPRIGSDLHLLRSPSSPGGAAYNSKSKRHLSLADAFGLDQMHNSPKGSKSSKAVRIIDSDSDDDNEIYGH